MPDKDASTRRPATRRAVPTDAQRAALRKYEVDPNKPVKVRTPKPPSRYAFLRVAIILSAAIIALVVVGGVLFKSNPSHSPLWWTGEALLLIAVMFVFALLWIAGRRRRR